MTRDAQATLRRITEILVQEYQPEKVILFGSYAYGEPDEDSDIDLLILKETDKSFFKRLAEVRRMVSEARKGFPFDPVVLTPQEFQEGLSRGDAFLKEIVAEGKVLYANST